MRRAARKDGTKDEIVATLRAAGCVVYDLRQPVDLLVGANGRTMLVECKDGRKPPSAQKYTPAQVAFMSTWTGGPVATVNDIAGALTVARMLKGLA